MQPLQRLFTNVRQELNASDDPDTPLPWWRLIAVSLLLIGAVCFLISLP